MKKIVFIGSRVHVYKAAITIGVSLYKVYALRGSFLEMELMKQGVEHMSFSMKEKNVVLDDLLASDFDILISNGCPILFPVQKFNSEQILLNIHPTYLPHLQGKTPLNGVFYLSYDFYGATMHFIDHGIDTGNIIYQKKVKLTPDVDLGLLYNLSLSLEGNVFEQGWKLLKNSQFKFNGYPQSKSDETYFNRSDEKRTLDFRIMDTELILRKIKSFGLLTQGCLAELEGNSYLIFDAEKIIHPRLVEQTKSDIPGAVVLKYDEKFLVRTLGGLIKVTRFKQLT